MWDFLLILGQVPGTDIQITFLDLVGFCLLLLIIWLARKKFIGSRHVSHPARLDLNIKKGEQLRLPI